MLGYENNPAIGTIILGVIIGVVCFIIERVKEYRQYRRRCEQVWGKFGRQKDTQNHPH